jgi:RNA polymerase sigma factor (sigma-70 family)
MSLTINQAPVKTILFEEIYSEYWDKMLRNVCMRYTKDRNKAEDYCQNGFIKVYNNLHKYSAEGSLEGWISRIIRNNIIDEIRREREFTYLSSYETLLSVEDEVYEEKYNVEMIYDVLDKLPKYAKQAFDMYYNQGLKHDQIAEKLGITTSTSKTNLMKAKNKIRELLNV